MNIFGDINKKMPVDFNSIVNSNNLNYWSIRRAPYCCKKRVLLNASFKQGELSSEFEKEFDTIMEAVEYLYNFLKSV